MIGKFNFKNANLLTDSEGNITLTLQVSSESKYALSRQCENLKKTRNTPAKLEVKKNKRSLDQNALLWALLTIYAQALGGGRTGSVQPEDIYIKMLSKYGIAEYLVIPEIAVESLKQAYRDVQMIDNAYIERNGRKTPAKVVKCVLGSSQYDTKRMAHLVDGVFDELAVIGIDANTSREVKGLYDDWREHNGTT